MNVDKNPAYPIAFEAIKREGFFRPRSSFRQCKYLNNVIEQDHRFIKRRTRPMLGFKRFTTAWRTVRGIEMMQVLRHGTGTVDGEGRLGRSDAADPQGVRIGRVARSTQRTLARDPKRCIRTDETTTAPTTSCRAGSDGRRMATKGGQKKAAALHPTPKKKLKLKQVRLPFDGDRLSWTD